jgi:CubicO group peptidase (beta-lactamase class C family)
VGVYRDGTLAWARGYGLASVEHGVPIGPWTVFDLGSTSKQFTAALVLLLVQDGAVGLDDPVRRHLELPAWGDTVTVRQLLHHTAGVRDYLTLFRLAGVATENRTTQADAVRLIARQRALDFAPGTAWGYSNSGYVLLAELVARRAWSTPCGGCAACGTPARGLASTRTSCASPNGGSPSPRSATAPTPGPGRCSTA